METLLGRWQTRGKKYVIEMWQVESGYEKREYTSGNNTANGYSPALRDVQQMVANAIRYSKGDGINYQVDYLQPEYLAQVSQGK